MKMKNETYLKILATLELHKEHILAHKTMLLLPANVNYTSLDVRLAFDTLRYFFGSKFICSLYDEEDLNDIHIQTATIKALKAIGVLS